MSRINPSGVFFAFAVIAVVSFMGTQGVEFAKACLKLATSAGFHHLLIVLGTGALGGVMAGLNRRLPNYASRPPLSALMSSTRPIAMAALAGVTLIAVALACMTVVDYSTLSFWSLSATLALNSGAVVACLCYALSMVRQYRAECAWEDAVHPK